MAVMCVTAVALFWATADAIVNLGLPSGGPVPVAGTFHSERVADYAARQELLVARQRVSPDGNTGAAVIPKPHPR
jgi:hypothetical protein